MKSAVVALAVVISLAVLVATAGAGGTLCPGPEICPDGDVKWVVYQGGQYKYTDGSAEVWGDRDIVYWSRSDGYRLTSLCIQTWRGTWVWEYSPPQEGWLDDHQGPVCAVVIESEAVGP